ncbi:hypothetical protein ACFCXR_22025 [Streptomyces noursei]|uniref:hypothetical protein n=1 Tax=Streptomyces TaxID=1883 RepID=UPI0035DCC314
MTSESPRRVPVALYITTDHDAAELPADYCRQFAGARDWDVIDTVTDADRQLPLTSRPGWTRILELLAAGTVGAVVTYSAQMIAESGADFEGARSLLQGYDAFLSVARSTNGTPTPPSRHTPAQAARRRDVADAAAGYEGCGAEWGALQ